MDASTAGKYYDEEFNQNLLLVKDMVQNLPRRQDREIAKKWITKLCHMQSNDLTVKKNRNQFFRYLMEVLYRGVYDYPEPHMGFPQYATKYGEQGEHSAGKSFMSRWSVDKRTYVAVKPMPGQGALVYMAVSKMPEIGWDYHH